MLSLVVFFFFCAALTACLEQANHVNTKQINPETFSHNRHYKLMDFIKERAPGNLTSCEVDFAQLV